MCERSWASRLTAFVLVFAPLIVTRRAYCEWNRERVGAPIVTTISQRTLLDALGGASRHDPAIFSGSGTLDQVGHRVLTSFGVGAELDEANEANAILHRDFGWSAVRIAHEASIAYLAAWIHHPAAMVRYALSHLTETQLHQAVRPIETLRDVLLWNTGSDRDFARDRAVRGGNWWMIPAVVVHRLAEAVSIAIFVAFIVVTPLRLVRDGWTAGAIASLGLWSVYLTFFAAYAAVHLEPRYLAPVVPGSIVVGAANIAWLVTALRGRSSARRAGTARRSLTPAAGKRRRADASLN